MSVELDSPFAHHTSLEPARIERVGTELLPLRQTVESAIRVESRSI
jgi:hypothetical protein